MPHNVVFHMNGTTKTHRADGDGLREIHETLQAGWSTGPDGGAMLMLTDNVTSTWLNVAQVQFVEISDIPREDGE